MTLSLSLILIAALGGLTVAVQGQMMGLIDKNVGTLESVFLTYGVGGALAAVAMLLARGGNLSAITTLPWWTLLSGVLGLVIVATIGYTVPRLGLTVAFTVVVASQFLFSMLLDHFGLFGAEVRQIDMNRLLGVAMLIGGVWFITR